MMQKRCPYIFVTVFALGACGDGKKHMNPDGMMPMPDGMPDGPVMAMQMIDEQGGTVETPGGEVTLTIPPNSVDSDTMITIAVSSDPPPAGAQGPVYEFGPAGLVFAHPVKIALAMPEGVTSGDVYWSKPGGQTGYDDIGGTVTGSKIEAEIVHFSSGYVGPMQSTRTVTGSQMIA